MLRVYAHSADLNVQRVARACAQGVSLAARCGGSYFEARTGGFSGYSGASDEPYERRNDPDVLSAVFRNSLIQNVGLKSAES